MNDLIEDLISFFTKTDLFGHIVLPEFEGPEITYSDDTVHVTVPLEMYPKVTTNVQDFENELTDKLPVFGKFTTELLHIDIACQNNDKSFIQLELRFSISIC